MPTTTQILIAVPVGAFIMCLIYNMDQIRNYFYSKKPIAIKEKGKKSIILHKTTEGFVLKYQCYFVYVLLGTIHEKHFSSSEEGKALEEFYQWVEAYL